MRVKEMGPAAMTVHTATCVRRMRRRANAS
jgi:hypothetical protein